MPQSRFSQVISFFNTLTRRHLEWLYRVSTTRPKQVISLFVAMTLLSLATISTLHFETDIFRIFPTRLPALKLLLDSLEWTGSSQDAYFLLEGDRQLLPAEADRFAERLKSARIDGQPAFGSIRWRVFDESQANSFARFISFAVSHPQQFIAPDEMQSLTACYAPQQIDRSLTRLQNELAGQFGSSLTGILTADPLYLRDLILPRLKSGSQALDLDPASPYFISRNGKMLIMIAEPARPVQDMVFARKLVAAINDARRGVPVSISCAGAHISAVMDEAAMKTNILISVATSLIVVLGIFYTAYRRLLPTLLIPLILACGVILSLGSAGMFLSSIHIISFAFTALITGIGTDYSIHIYDRFHSERAAGLDTEDALRLAMLDTGHGVFTAAVTTGIPFLALMISDVRALFELGLLVGLGVIFSFYVTFVALPPLLIFMDRRFPIIYRPIPGLGLSGVWRFVVRHPGWVTLTVLLIIAGLARYAPQVGFDGELKNLQPRHSEAFLAQEKLERNLSIAPRQLLVALEGRNLPDLLERLSQLDRLGAELVGRGEITAWSSLTQLMNSPSAQVRVSREIREVFSGRNLSESIAGRMDRLGFAREAFQPFLDANRHLLQAAPVPPEETLAHMKRSPFKGAVDRHLFQRGETYYAMAYFHYGTPGFNVSEFRKKLELVDPAARITGIDLVSEQLKESVRSSFSSAFLLGGMLVLFLLLVQFASRPSGVFYSLFPVVAAVVCMLGVMGLAGRGLNFMNAMVLVTIIGMGSDFGLYLRYRVSASVPESREAQYIQVGRSVFLSAMTTIVGFGSLALTDYGAMSSIGWATNVGVGFVTFFSLVALPAFMHLQMRPGKLQK